MRSIAISLFKKLFIVPFGSSIREIAILRTSIFPLFILRDLMLLKGNMKSVKILTCEEHTWRALKKYYLIKSDMFIWQTIMYNDFESSQKFNDFDSFEVLKSLVSRNKGVLLLGMHYGPMCSGYSLYKLGFQPAILTANIKNMDGLLFKNLLANEYTFVNTYDGIAKSNFSEKRFVEMILEGRVGMMMIDFVMHQRSRNVACLGVDVPIGEFSFKLALKYSLPVAVVWFSKMLDRGYRLNIEEISFGSIEEGVSHYGRILNRIVSEDPCRWHYGISVANKIQQQTS
jgi:lauroyl/myristoyl acyltransferase